MGVPSPIDTDHEAEPAGAACGDTRERVLEHHRSGGLHIERLCRCEKRVRSGLSPEVLPCGALCVDPHLEQVGQTGSRISPELYIPCGISGAIQHWAGCSSAKTILAINTDEDAPMVTKAHYAVIGDLHEIVPAVNEELRRRTA